MNPAQAMGTFLRVWRQEWAGLSREQLAIAISSRAPRARVTKYVVREWEQGQPPHSTAELEALLAVMQRHVITPAEAEQFRSVVFAACSSLRYPELFSDENIAYGDDIEEVVHSAAGSLVSLVHCVKRLEEAVRGDLSPQPSRVQQRRAQVGLAVARHLLAAALHSARSALGAATFAANADFVSAYFGPAGLGQELSVLGQRSNELLFAWSSAHAQRHLGEAAVVVGRQLEVRQRALDRGEEGVALHALYAALQGSSALLEEQARALIREGDRCRAMPEHDRPVARLEWERTCILYVASTLVGRLGEAERYLAALEADRHHDVWGREMDLGKMALYMGSHREAAGHFERALALCASPWEGKAAEAARWLQACDRAWGRPRTISIAK